MLAGGTGRAAGGAGGVGVGARLAGEAGGARGGAVGAGAAGRARAVDEVVARHLAIRACDSVQGVLGHLAVVAWRVGARRCLVLPGLAVVARCGVDARRVLASRARQFVAGGSWAVEPRGTRHTGSGRGSGRTVAPRSSCARRANRPSWGGGVFSGNAIHARGCACGGTVLSCLTRRAGGPARV